MKEFDVMTQIYEAIIYLLSNALRIYALYRFSNAFFPEKKLKWYLEFFAYSAFFLLNSTLFWAFDIPILNLGSNFVCLFGITCLYRKKIHTALVATTLMIAVNMLCDCLLYVLSVSSVVFSSGMATTLLLFLLALLAEAQFQNNPHPKLRRQQILAIFTIPTGSIIIAMLTMHDYRKEMVAESVVLMLINVCVFYLYGSLNRAYHELHLKKQVEQQIEAYTNQLRLLYHSEENLRYLRHDLKNHMYKMQSLLREKKYDELGAYIKQSQSYLNTVQQFSNSGNSDIDSLINYKLSCTQNLKIQTKLEIKLPESLVLNAFDVNIILGNLLDNALEALEESEERRLSIRISYDRNVLSIAMRNTCQKAPISKNGVLLTQKSEKIHQHGLGLQSVKYTAEKYHGTLETAYQNGTFSVYVVLFL